MSSVLEAFQIPRCSYKTMKHTAHAKYLSQRCYRKEENMGMLEPDHVNSSVVYSRRQKLSLATLENNMNSKFCARSLLFLSVYFVN